MPMRPGRQCNHPGCGQVADGAYCSRHKRDNSKHADQYRGTAASRGYDGRWRKRRAAYLLNNPLCVECLGHGEITSATCVDHIVPHRGDKDLFDDEDNWQALCDTCHGKKTARGE